MTTENDAAARGRSIGPEAQAEIERTLTPEGRGRQVLGAITDFLPEYPDQDGCQFIVTQIAAALHAHAEQARAEEREACAAIADGHKGSAANKRQVTGKKLSYFSEMAQDEITAEEMAKKIIGPLMDELPNWNGMSAAEVNQVSEAFTRAARKTATVLREAADAARADERRQQIAERFGNVTLHYAESKAREKERERAARIADAVSAQASVMRSMDAKGRRDAAAEIAAAIRASEGGESDEG